MCQFFSGEKPCEVNGLRSVSRRQRRIKKVYKPVVNSPANRVYSFGRFTCIHREAYSLSSQTGPVTRDFHTVGLTWSAVYLLDGTRPVLFEGGFACAGRVYADGIRRILGARSPEILFLTHSHWDHVGSVGYLKSAFPSLKVAASKGTADILKRPHALELIRRLSEDVIAPVESLSAIEPSLLLRDAFQPFTVDMIVKDGQVIDLGGGLSVEVIATPGHARDHLSYYVPQRGILIATETVGMVDRTGRMVTEFLFDYDAYVSSLKQLSSLPVEVLCQGHHFVFVGRDEVAAFFSRSIEAAEEFKENVYGLLRAEGLSVERVVRRIKEEQWDTNKAAKQIEAAYLINLRARVKHLAEKLKKEGG
jgi:glyoxylase-like metal-dependent hydrolase (beta-lactamase superfamily II)